MKTFFKDILEYTFTFNDKVIEALLINNDPPEKSVQLINHTINSQEIWNSRIENTAIDRGVWDVRPMEGLKDINRANYEKSIVIVESFDFDIIIRYTNTKGKTFENTIREMLFHVVNHSTYHRGQIASNFKQNGIEPLVTDYIFYKRSEI